MPTKLFNSLSIILVLLVFVAADHAAVGHHILWPRYPFSFRIGGLLCGSLLLLHYLNTERFYKEQSKVLHPFVFLMLAVGGLYLFAGALAHMTELTMSSARAKFAWSHVTDVRYSLQLLLPLAIGSVMITVVRKNTDYGRSIAMVLIGVSGILFALVQERWLLFSWSEFRIEGHTAVAWSQGQLFLLIVSILLFLFGFWQSLETRRFIRWKQQQRGEA